MYKISVIFIVALVICLNLGSSLSLNRHEDGEDFGDFDCSVCVSCNNYAGKLSVCYAYCGCTAWHNSKNKFT